ncbi:unnamed protein product [Cyprideis torosa]|uniref:Uncharacterized protein n=1 Tax=Cyprideis torosa TaxID=163714 RepID=A0A7R8ZHZ4_9CRUS|nr:unnamed protein product [Cyprideis torosa]CAG0878908.1 unnamed protein product [Cyprideis torosa]
MLNDVLTEDINSVTMVLSNEDRILIKSLRQTKHWGTKRLMKEFPNHGWKKTTVDRFLKKVDATGDHRPAAKTGRPKTARTEGNILTIGTRTISDEGNRHQSLREAVRDLPISKSSAHRIVKKDLGRKSYSRISVQQLSERDILKRLERCRRLRRKIHRNNVGKTFFTDEKVFTVRTPRNSGTDRVYSRGPGLKRTVSPKRLLRPRQHFCASVMVAGGIGKAGKTRIVFVPTGVKINSQRYCDAANLPDVIPVIYKSTSHDGEEIMRRGTVVGKAATDFSIAAIMAKENTELNHATSPSPPPTKYILQEWEKIYFEQQYDVV